MQEGKVLQIPEERREVKRSEKKGRKGKIYPAECRVPENSKERQGLLQCKEIEENNKKGKTRVLFKKIGESKEYFMQKWAQ